MAIEVVVFLFGSVRLLVGTLSGHCQIHQLAIQFVFGSVRVPSWYLKWAMPGLPGCDCGLIVCDLEASAFSRMSDP